MNYRINGCEGAIVAPIKTPQTENSSGFREIKYGSGRRVGSIFSSVEFLISSVHALSVCG